MTVKLTGGCPATPENIESLQRKVGKALPASYIKFVSINDGAVPESNILKAGDDVFCVNKFILVSDVYKNMMLIENLPKNAFPIASDDSGNYFILALNVDGAVLFWDHEIPESLARLAPSFGTFVDSLIPFNTSSIELRPDQVLDVWVDPEFRKGLQGGG